MKKILVVLLVAFALVACTKKAKNEVYVFNWSEYIPDEVIAAFEKETGITVIYSTFDSNEAMYAKLKVLDGAGYDVTFPSTYYVDKMVDEKLIQTIDKSKLPNLKDMDMNLMGQAFDPENKYSIPFAWGSTGIGVNTKFIDASKIKSWKDLWRPEFKGILMLQNDVREVFHVALRSLGFSGNTTDEKEIEAAYNELKKLIPSVRLFNSDSPKIPYLNEEVYVGMLWGGEAFRANKINPNIQYIYPEDGVAIWADSMVIPAKAKNIDNAHTFINFILRPDIQAMVSDGSGYTSPVLSAKKYLDNTTVNSRMVYPKPEDLVNSEMQMDVGDAIVIYEKFWEKLKSN